jgi:hypothetical protein
MAAFIQNLPTPELTLALSGRLSSVNGNLNSDTVDENKDSANKN